MAKKHNSGRKLTKIIRVIWSLSLLLLFISIFVIPEEYSAAADWQAITAGLRLLTGFALLSIFAFFMLETLLFGRIYCSFTCPLGVLQDIAIFASKIFKLRRNNSFTINRRALRYSLLAFLTAAVLFGAAVPLGLFGPFANFGRFSAAAVKPAYNWFNNMIAEYPLDNPPFSLLLLVSGLTAILALLTAAFFNGRIFCNTLCPAGGILGLLSKFSLFRFVLKPDKCTKCGMCEKVCKAKCIDAKNGIIDTERCVSCFNCAAACRFDAIAYTVVREKISVKPDLSRREFLAAGGAAAIGAAVVPHVLKGAPSPQAVMPPGAMNFDHFTSRCTACQLCVSNCPGKVLKPAALQYGLSGFMQPRLDFDSGMCEFECVNCSRICPNDALKPLSLERKKRLQLGVANYCRKRCVVVTDRTHCGACAEHCPTGAVYMEDWEEGLTIPKVKPELCIGCGACEYICPVQPDKAITVTGFTVQGKAKVGKYKQVINHLKGQDFPF